MLTIPTVVRMVLSKDPEAYLKRAIEVNKKAKKIKALGGKIEILGFVRFEKGEGLEKRSDDFAAEVASMVK